MAEPDQNETPIAPLLSAMRDFSGPQVKQLLSQMKAVDVRVRLFHPIGDLVGPDAFLPTHMPPLLTAMPDLERRDFIVLAGQDADGQSWVGCAGHYVGTFVAPFLDIPPTGHFAHMRFHEFYRIEGGKIAEIQAIWDLPELMMQAEQFWHPRMNWYGPAGIGTARGIAGFRN